MDVNKTNIESPPIEVLEFSKEHSKHLKKQAKKETGYYTRSFYQGREFTSRTKIPDSDSDSGYNFSDKKLIFKGVIDEILVTTEVE